MRQFRVDLRVDRIRGVEMVVFRTMEDDMKAYYFSILTLALSGSLAACSTWNKLNRTEKGAVIGGGTGVAVGNIVSPGLGGTLVGGAAGAGVGALVGHETEDQRRRK